MNNATLDFNRDMPYLLDLAEGKSFGEIPHIGFVLFSK
jgi:hypothetical protein